MLEQRIQQQFFDSADLHYAAAEVLAKPVNDAVSALIGCITAGGKVLACGNGGSAADAQHFAAARARAARDPIIAPHQHQPGRLEMGERARFGGVAERLRGRRVRR